MTTKLMFSKGVTDTKEVLYFIKNFNSKGILFGDGKRNKIKLFTVGDKTINIKSFKKPHLINKIVYKYFRKSKARRSFEYATTLLEKGIGTPQPIAYFENYDLVGLKDSYYVSEHLDCDLTFRELVLMPDFPDHEAILRQFTQFSFHLHENGVEFLDHSPGNTLIKKREDGNYDFFLVDLNRMNFHQNMDFDARMKNLSRLTPKKEMVVVMSIEYARLYGKTEQVVFDTLWRFTSDFQYKFYRKKRLKKRLKFWK
ncbi:lipopolysaccharide kinase InaA family protein [Flavobacterium eburneipallidum]|uniref:lipopolysaccharide kinase InaA family protein n=1 Tax=Flavobacterium eburneipallidum TaxID=3003263 RepID=UPI00248266EC|nr:lipopolysaccharide kinase InaA family protein [Flavobacterium eburneipallidum]